MNTALKNTERIQSIFLDTQLFYATHDNMPALIEYLENTNPEFRSIAYESASMALAIKDLETGSFPDEWLAFANSAAKAHTAQVYVGLGWAIAKLNLPFLEIVKELDTQLYFRIADGCGYYDGSFRRRPTVLSQQLPAYLPAAAMPIYDQGVGRSIWYSAKTDINKIHSLIETFPVNRQADMWRGIGIAVAYVGGSNNEDLKTLLHYAGTNGPQLAYGAALAARSRMLANTMTADTDRCSRLWFTHTARELNLFASNLVDIDDVEFEIIYLNWINQIEKRLSGSFEK
jgi:enediyne biosynthesis protein E3